MLAPESSVEIEMDERLVREQLGEALGTVRPLVTLSREGLVLTALEWGVNRPAAYETATAAARDGALELREQGGGSVPLIEAVTKEKPVVLFAGDTVVGGKQNRIINVWGLRQRFRPSTVKRHLADLRARLGLTTEQLIYVGTVAGWLVVPSLEFQ
jgi:hypothetical protein